MATVRLRNTNPLGQVDVPLLGRQGEPLDTEGVGCLEPGEVFEVDKALAAGLLEQTGNYELVDGFPDGEPAEAWTRAQLEAYATAHAIDVTGATNKAGVLAAIKKD